MSLGIAIKIARNSVKVIENAVKQLLGEGQLANELGPTAPLLCGKNVDLRGYEMYALVGWLAKPEGPPPEAKFRVLRSMLQDCSAPLDDDELDKLFGGVI